MSCWRRATGFASSPAEARLQAAYDWGTAAAERAADWPQAADALAKAVELLPLAVWQGLDRTSQESRLMAWPSLGTDAAACAIAAGRPEQAVELLETGRSVLWRHALNLRTDLTALKESHRELAGRLDAVRAELQRDAPDPYWPRQPEAERRWRAAREWDDLLLEIRALEGYGRFLLPPSFAQLKAVGEAGPVVTVNVSRHRCDALMTGPGGVRLIPLPELSLEQARRRTELYLNAVSRLGAGLPAAGNSLQIVRQALEWLWDTVARPVFTELGPLPRVWWCPTGPLTLLPLHAAGYHGKLQGGEPQTVLDLAASSYTPTLGTLIRARQAAEVPGELRRLLVVAILQSPRYAEATAPLPGAALEATLLAERFGDGQTPLVGEAATLASVLGHLPMHAFAHFACHGGQDLYRPAQGALLLHDAPLRVLEVARLDLPHAELAFLSACRTATGGVLYLDESIHLAAALQLVGYRHVLGTLWSIADQPAPDIADDIWAAMTEHGLVDGAGPARAVHTVIRALRDRQPDRPDVWAPYVHLGP